MRANTPLGTLHYSGARTRYWPLKHARSLFYHPTLHELTISCATADSADVEMPINEFQGSTPLRKLTFVECHISVAAMEVLLALPKALQTFENTNQRETHTSDGAPIISLAGIIQYLVVYQPKLENLTYASVLKDRSTVENHKLNLSSLKTLRHLTLPYNYGRLSQCLIPAVSCLAPTERSTSLETVMLGAQWDEGKPQSAVTYHRALGLHLPDYYPKLRTLVIVFRGLLAPIFCKENAKPQATLYVEAIKNSLRKDFRERKVRFVVQTTVTMGPWIPPYLFGESAPRHFTIYDSGAEDHVAEQTQAEYLDIVTR